MHKLSYNATCNFDHVLCTRRRPLVLYIQRITGIVYVFVAESDYVKTSYRPKQCWAAIAADHQTSIQSKLLFRSNYAKTMYIEVLRGCQHVHAVRTVQRLSGQPFLTDCKTEIKVGNAAQSMG